MPSAKQKKIKRQKQYAQNKDAAKCYMKEYREKKKDSIQLSKKEYYKSNENKIRHYYVENKDDKRQYYVENKDAKRQYYVENKDSKRQYYVELKGRNMKKTRIPRSNILRNIISKKRTPKNITTKSTTGFRE